ncbi:PucR family transcriptional regulator [Kineococcus aurantiacus]|uniref:PucR family transcriptional regulator n=1 Tax=Kineococcus aurantiacus TaxID=37633 RepID=UPI0031E3A307
MPMSIAGLATAAGLAIVSAGAGLDRPVLSVRIEGRPGTAEGPVAVVLPWTPLRRGAALPPLVEQVEAVLRTGATAVVVVPADRSVHPPAELAGLVADSLTAVLWSPAQEPEALAARLTTLTSGGEVASGRPEMSAAGLLEGDLDVTSIAEALASALAAEVTVTAAAPGAGPVGALEPVRVFGADPSHGAEPHTTPEVLDDAPRLSDDSVSPTQTELTLDLIRSGRLVGAVRLLRDEPLSPSEVHHAHLAARLLALSLSADEAERRDRQAWRPALAAVLGDNLAARENAIRRSRRLGTFPARSVVFLAIIPFGQNLHRSGLQRLSRAVETAALHIDPKALVMEHEGYVVMLVGSDLDLDRVQRTVYRGVNLPLCVGSSRPVSDVRRFAGAFRQAQRAVTIARALGWANRVATYDALGVTRLLHQLPEYERREFTRDVLGPIAGTDEAAVEGRRVLRSYRTANGNFSAAAQQVFLHHNTYRQRIARLQEQLGDFVNDAEVRISVFIALDLHRFDNDRAPEG